MDNDEEQGTSLLSSSPYRHGNNTVLRQSKTRLVETIAMGNEILKTLHSDQQTVKRLGETMRNLERNTVGESNEALDRIERKRLLELAFVCVALTAVLCGIFLLLFYRMIQSSLWEDVTLDPNV